jgi:hypothetical protein
MLLGLWDVSREALQAGQVQGLISLTYLTKALQFSAILLVGLLPRYSEDLLAMKQDSFRSTIGGALFLSVTFFSIVYVITVGAMTVIAPSWMGELQ